MDESLQTWRYVLYDLENHNSMQKTIITGIRQSGVSAIPAPFINVEWLAAKVMVA